MAKLAIDRASIGKKSGDFHSKSGAREIFIILSKIGRSPEKSGDLEVLEPRPGHYSRMSFSSDQATGTVFPHLNMPFLPNSKFI